MGDNWPYRSFFLVDVPFAWDVPRFGVIVGTSQRAAGGPKIITAFGRSGTSQIGGWDIPPGRRPGQKIAFLGRFSGPGTSHIAWVQMNEYLFGGTVMVQGFPWHAEGVGHCSDMATVYVVPFLQ